VSFTAVIRVVTQFFSPPINGQALRCVTTLIMAVKEANNDLFIYDTIWELFAVLG